MLRPITATIAHATLHDRSALEELVAARVSRDWPTDLAPLLPMYEDECFAATGATGWGPWVAVDPVKRELVADVGFKGAPAGSGSVEIGFGTVARHRGRGYATEAASALLTWAFADHRVSEVVAECERDNHASTRVLTKLGMEQVGGSGTLLLWRLGRAAMP